MSIIGLLFAGKPQCPPDSGWERFSNLAISGDLDLVEWGPILDRAKSMGFAVTQEDGTIHIWKSENCNGRFMTAKGGYKLAEQFLDSVR